MLKMKKINYFFGYFDPESAVKILKINNLRGDLSKVSTLREPLHITRPGIFRTSTQQVYLCMQNGCTSTPRLHENNVFSVNIVDLIR